jgi:hypothetical protein
MRRCWLIGIALIATTTITAQSPGEILSGTASPVPMVLVPVDAAPAPPPKAWTGGIDFGINGTDGNSQNFNMRLGADAKRERADGNFTTSLIYNYATNASLRTANQALFNNRYEWLFADSPWSRWVSGGLEYNEFRAFDLLLTAHAGVGYAWWKTEAGYLKTRAGFGGSQPIGGPDESFIPEAMLGVDYERRIYDRAKFIFGGQLFPNLGDWFEYRAEIRAALDILIDPEHNLGLKLGVVDQYFSDPQGRKPNDLQYFMALTWRF